MAFGKQTTDGKSEEATPAEKIYTSHPVSRFGMGRFRFKNGTLKLTDPKDIEEFEKLLESQPDRIRAQVRTISLAAAERLVRAAPKMATKDFDSSVGRRETEELKKEAPTVGSTELGTEPKADDSAEQKSE
jgi:hypothetical protein